MTEETVHGRILAKKSGIYTIFVIQCDDDSLRMCTLLPYWGSEYSNLQIGDSGFFTTQFFKAGETYYNRKTDKDEKIRFTNIYFKEFIKDNKQSEKIIL